ncbi:MAG: ComEA family DNA-binding protein [Sporichthyaceae bacterium]
MNAARRRVQALLRLLRDFWWVLPAFLGGLFTWLSFYILGMRLHRRELIFTGTAYSAYSAMLWFAFSRAEIEYSDAASTLATIALLIGWIGGVLHVFAVATAFERELAGAPAPRRAGSRRRAAPGSVGAAGDVLGFAPTTAEYFAAPAPQASQPPVQANTATERELSALPGASPQLVARWLAERTRRGGFRDLAELTRALELTPHQVVRLRTRICFEDPGPSPERSGRGRVLDV